MIGCRFGRLIVLAQSARRNPNHRGILWICQCDCGQTKEALGSHLGTRINSCGCLHKFSEGSAAKLSIFKSYQKRARQGNLNWDLSLATFSELTSRNCYYCGTSPSNTHKMLRGNGFYRYNGIDRLDNRVGYEPWNVVTCCKLCNYAKRDLTLTDFLDWVDRLTTHHTNRPIVEAPCLL